jgi:hypothetical protein
MNGYLVLAIDDAEEDLKPLIPDEFETIVIHPDDEKLSDKLAEHIDRASLVLLDQKFNDDPQPLSIKAADGASFVAHLRSWSRLEGKALPPLVLLTNQDDAFKNEVPSVGAALPLGGTFVGREFRIAPALDVEWVQHKPQNDTSDRIRELVSAFAAAKHAAGTDGVSLDELKDLLGLPEDKLWTEQAKEELRNARPPVSQKENPGPEPCGPPQIIRWLCHRALPFPGMFLSDLYAAWTLGLSLEAFKDLAAVATDSSGTDWLKDLDDAEYYGPLSEFIGRRWWKSGIDYLAWQLDTETDKKKERKVAWGALAPGFEIGDLRSPSTHVVVWTPDLIENEILAIDAAAQLHPPGWPAEALEPWISKTDLDSDAVLKAMIEAVDLR